MAADPDAMTGSPSDELAEFAAAPDAPLWARDCAWVPGSGYCRNRPCSSACLFHAQREAEAAGVLQSRRRRRQRRRRSVERTLRIAPIALAFCDLVASAVPG